MITRIQGLLTHVDDDAATVVAGAFDYQVLIPDLIGGFIVYIALDARRRLVSRLDAAPAHKKSHDSGK